MKIYNHIKKMSLLLLILATACNKEECKYDNQVVDCIEKEPEGYMVVTKRNPSNSNVAFIYKTTYNGNAPVGGDWNNPGLGTGQVGTIATPKWNTTDIGNVFGIALDNSKNIYLAATDVYTYDSFGPPIFGPGGRSGIYKTNVATPTLTTTLTTTLVANTGYTVGTNQIPNSGIGSGNSIGNVAFDKTNNQLFATNLEDGRIYRIDPSTGNVKSILDPFFLDTPANGMVAVNERIWGVGVITQIGVTEVFFARSELTFNSIWSVKLDASGEFIAISAGGVTPKLFIDTAPKNEVQKVGSQNKISDIEFSCSGKMLMAERGNPHASSIFEYKKVGATWTLTHPYFLGGFSGANSAGGVDYGSRETAGSFLSDDIVWGSQNYARPVKNTYYSYGVEGISSLGNLASTYNTTDLFIDFDGVGTSIKGGIGDVDVFDSSCPCNN